VLFLKKKSFRFWIIHNSIPSFDETIQIWALQVLNYQGHFSIKKYSKLLFLLHSFEKIERVFLKSNHWIFYFTCLRSYGKNFMKFDSTNWKTLALKVGKNVFLNASQHQMTLTTILWKMIALWTLKYKNFVLKNWAQSVKRNPTRKHFIFNL